MGENGQDLTAIEGGKRPMTHAEATARVRAINSELSILDTERRALLAEREWARAEQRRALAGPSSPEGER